MPRSLDHIVHAVHDLDAAAALYRRLGFRVGARNRHPWGTHNCIVQLPGFFVELLTVAEPEKLSNEGIPLLFGHYHRKFLEHRQGLSMLVLESADAVQDAAAFKTAGIGISDALSFEREAKRPDGGAVKVGFALAFARDDAAPEAAFMTCQQLYPENFWNPAFQIHSNGAQGIAGVVLVAEKPSDHHIFLSALAGERELHSTSLGLRVPTPRGDIEAMNPTAYRDRFGAESPDVRSGARLAAIRFAVADIGATADTLVQGGLAGKTRHGCVVVGLDLAFGATLVFEQEAASGAG